MRRQKRVFPAPSNVVNAAPMLLALREVRGLSALADLETAQLKALATLRRIAAGGAGALRQRASAALWGLGLAPGAQIPCNAPAEIVGECTAATAACARCVANLANQGCD